MDELFAHIRGYWPLSNSQLAKQATESYEGVQPEAEGGGEAVERQAEEDMLEDTELAKALGVPDELVARMSPSKPKESLQDAPNPMAAVAQPEVSCEPAPVEKSDRQRRIEALQYPEKKTNRFCTHTPKYHIVFPCVRIEPRQMLAAAKSKKESKKESKAPLCPQSVDPSKVDTLEMDLSPIAKVMSNTLACDVIGIEDEISDDCPENMEGPVDEDSVPPTQPDPVPSDDVAAASGEQALDPGASKSVFDQEAVSCDYGVVESRQAIIGQSLGFKSKLHLSFSNENLPPLTFSPLNAFLLAGEHHSHGPAEVEEGA